MSQVFHSHTVNYPVVRTPAFKIIQTFLTVERMSSFKVTSSLYTQPEFTCSEVTMEIIMCEIFPKLTIKIRE